MKGKISISQLKEFAVNDLPKHAVLRDILLSEKDDVDVNVFLARLPIWLRLMRLEKTQRHADEKQ